MSVRQKVVSLTAELQQLGQTVDCARLIVELLAMDALSSEEQAREAPSSIAATLVLVRHRLKALESTLRGNTDPAVIWNPGNAASEKQNSWDDGDVRLSAWTEGERMRRISSRARKRQRSSRKAGR